LVFDALIIGAGPAGSTTSFLLAKSGFKVLMIDKNFPRRKICGDGITPKSIELIDEVGFKISKKVIKRWMRGVFLTSMDGSSTHIRATNPEEESYVTDRLIFDSELADNALDAGVEFWRNAEALNAIIEDDSVRGASIKSQGKRLDVKAKITVSAEGFASKIMRQLGLSNRSPKTTSTSIRAIYTGVKDLTDEIELHFNSMALEGYGWIFPQGENQANVGIGGLNAKYLEKRITLSETFKWFTKKHPVAANKLREAKIADGPSGYTLIFGAARRTYGDGLIAVGEAAGFCSPITGEGIRFAFESGKIAAQTIKEALIKEDFSLESLSIYEKRWRRVFGGDLKYGPMLRTLSQGNDERCNITVSKCNENSSWKRMMQLLIIGKIPYKNVFKYVFSHPSLIPITLKLVLS